MTDPGFYSAKEDLLGCLRWLLYLALFVAVVHVIDYVRTPGVATVLGHRDGYHTLVDVLAERAEAEGLDVVALDKMSVADRAEWTEGELSAVLRELRVSCVLYVHTRWYSYEQRGLLVAGDVPRWGWGDVKTRAYKLVDGRFEWWTDGERRGRGPYLYKHLHPMEGERFCSTSG